MVGLLRRQPVRQNPTDQNGNRQVNGNRHEHHWRPLRSECSGLEERPYVRYMNVEVQVLPVGALRMSNPE
jgi:hypothetical protein